MAHKRICKERRKGQARFASTPGALEVYTALREFSGKHRSTIGACAFQSVRYHYQPPHSSDPIATSKLREDVLVIHLRTRPNAEEARPEKCFFATDAHLETITSYFREEQQEDMRSRLKWCIEQGTRNRGPSSAVLVVWVVDDSIAPVRPATVMPSLFSLDQSEVAWLAFPWKEFLLHNLNEGIVH
ncbi:hypothetical protein FOMPIDRAFT_93563 [Fomitopsis schrenkii]|uniref:Uncharacterized protein n=1 Tax=Fomitopsis schrenkii TaxID=2126942 RepID=S8EYI3_FOMSC|nr:hypothetical protein FOMPIDRAFT_93563 [Fomitopsis schrenkii]